jgi:hypothetical protein
MFLNKNIDKLVKSPKYYSYKTPISFVIVFIAIGAYFIISSFAATPVIASIQAENMTPLPPSATVVTDPNASGGKAVYMNGSTGFPALSATINLPSTATSLSIVAKAGSTCGNTTLMKATIDGKTAVQDTSVSGTTYKSYNSSALNLTAGNHTLFIKEDQPNTACKHQLYLDVTNFYGPANTNPPPTVSISATPNQVTSGSSSTITWTSTNASSCTASGTWNGTEQTQGTYNTGALNTNSNYNLSCTGPGGTASGSAPVTVESGQSGGLPGTPSLYAVLGPEWNQYDACAKVCTTPPKYASFISSKFNLSEGYDSYYQQNNDALSWNPKSVFYDDSYAIYPGSEQANWILQNHSDWVLHSPSGKILYINYACNAGTCTQYAGNIANKAFVNYWLTGCGTGNRQTEGNVANNCDPGGSNGAEGTMAEGFKGVMMDDFNIDIDDTDGTTLDSNGNLANIAPLDTNTGTTMTADQWSQAWATFGQTVRAAFPSSIIIHNTPWTDGTNGTLFSCIIISASCSNSNQPDLTAFDSIVKSANYIMREGGAVDGGLSSGFNNSTGNDWQFSYDTLQRYVDYIHNLGTNVIWLSYGTNRASDNFPSNTNTTPSLDDIEYNLASYLLANTGGDMVSDSEMYPTNGTFGSETLSPLWNGYNVNLGNATGPRQIIQDQYYQRNFTNGMVLLSPPAGSGDKNYNPITINLPAGKYYRYNSAGVNQQVNSVTLSPYEAAVLNTQQ